MNCTPRLVAVRSSPDNMTHRLPLGGGLSLRQRHECCTASVRVVVEADVHDLDQSIPPSLVAAQCEGRCAEAANLVQQEQRPLEFVQLSASVEQIPDAVEECHRHWCFDKAALRH